MSCPSTLKQITRTLSVVGAIDSAAGELTTLTERFKSALYLCSDTGDDTACGGGFELVSGSFKGGHLHFHRMFSPSL